MDTVKSRGRQRRSRDNSMLSLADIAALGKVDEAAVERCIREDPRFPEPVAHRSTGDLYDQRSVYKWAIEAGLEALEPGRHTHPVGARSSVQRRDSCHRSIKSRTREIRDASA